MSRSSYLVHVPGIILGQHWSLSTTGRYTPVSNLHRHRTGGQYDGKRYCSRFDVST